MKHTHVLEGDTLEDIRAAAQELFIALSGSPRVPAASPRVSISPAIDEVPKAPPKPKATAKKAEPVAAVEAPVAAEVVEPPVATEVEDDFLSETPSPEKPLTEADVREVAKKAVDAHGQPAVRDLLVKTFDVKRLTDLKSSDYTAFVDAVKKLK